MFTKVLVANRGEIAIRIFRTLRDMRIGSVAVYSDIDRTALHPTLAENASFARAVEDAGLVWIGPPPAAIELMGSKTRARRAMQDAGVPIIPGTTDPVGNVDEVVALGEEIGYPLLIKAAAGGGGKGMKVVRNAGEAAQAF